MKSEVYKRKVDTRDELLAGLLDPTARIKKRADDLRRTACDFRTRVAKCIQVDCGILERVFGTVTDMSSV
jgi:hypothetical protein